MTTQREHALKAEKLFAQAKRLRYAANDPNAAGSAIRDGWRREADNLSQEAQLHASLAAIPDEPEPEQVAEVEETTAEKHTRVFQDALDKARDGQARGGRGYIAHTQEFIDMLSVLSKMVPGNVFVEEALHGVHFEFKIRFTLDKKESGIV